MKTASLFSFLILIGVLNFTNCQNENRLSSNYISDNIVIKKLTKNTYLHTSFLKTKEYGSVPCNGVIIVEDGEAIVIDTPIDSVSTEELINFIHTQLNANITIVIPTHYHIDCIGGLDVFLADETTTVASFRTISQLPTELDKVEFTFYSDTLISLGKHEINIFYPGPGHTEDNIVAYYPKDQMLFGGCLIKAIDATKGNLQDANTEEWSNSIERIEMKFPEIEVLVPGHGEAGDTSLLSYTYQLFKS